MEKIVKTRKIHTCQCCGLEIKKNSKALHVKERVPIFEELDFDIFKQIGITYHNFYYHYENMEVIKNEDGKKWAIPDCA